jgi:hypothetical protein
MAAVSQDGQWRSGFYLGAGLSAQTGAPVWRFTMYAKDINPDVGPNYAVAATGVIAAEQIGQWVHLIAVSNAIERKIKLYVNGVKVSDVMSNEPWAANGPFAIGRGRWASGGVPIDSLHWDGGIDRVWAFVGAMEDAEAAALYQQMS